MVKRQTYYGSGTMYEFVVPASMKDASGNISIPSTKNDIRDFVELYATAETQIGFLKNGFQVEITTEKLEDQSDLGEMKITLITKETATGTFALFNSCGDTISRLYPTASTSGDVTTVGGLANTTQDDHILIFVSANKNDLSEQSVFICVGKNTEGFSINWNPDSVEPMSCKYDIVPFDSTGKLFRIAEIDLLPTLPIVSGTAYPIVFDTQGGTWDADADVPTSYTTGTAVTLPDGSDITRGSDTFAGWYEVSDIATRATAIAATATGGKKFIAAWSST